MSEKELVYLLENEIRKRGAEIAFATIVAFGPNAASPHHVSNETKLRSRDTLLIDFGAKVNGYHSDMTRTFFMGEPTEKETKLYEAVLTSQQKAVEYITSQLQAGKEVSAGAVDAQARGYLTAHNLPSFPHSLGHGIGLAVHEAPSLSPNSPDLLTEGMVFSIEPGVYVSNEIGIRIEDLYTITKGTLTQLTTSPNRLTTL